MNISALNLNLLKVLHAVLQEEQVSAAAKRACLSQPAASNVLKQLRELLDDPLLIRGQGGKMQLTPYAQSIRAQVAQLVSGIEDLFSGEEAFNPLTSQRIFRIGMSDYLSAQLLPPLLKRLQTIAPGIKIIVHHVNRLADPERLRSQELDLVIGNFSQNSPVIQQEILFEDHAGFICCAKHPLARKRKITLDLITQHPLVMVAYMDNPEENYLDTLLQSQGYTEQVSLVVPHAWTALSVLPGTKYISHTTHKMAHSFVQNKRLCFLPTPKELLTEHKQPYIAKQYWHKSLSADCGLRWLRLTLQQLLRE
jgi:molybdate transport repressor ModE-like protein